MAALQDKVALVTGASSGLGAETARLLSRQGATVFGIGRDIGRLAETFADVERGSYASVDVASAQACRGAVKQCVRELGGLDVLVNIAVDHPVAAVAPSTCPQIPYVAAALRLGDRQRRKLEVAG